MEVYWSFEGPTLSCHLCAAHCLCCLWGKETGSSQFLYKVLILQISDFHDCSAQYVSCTVCTLIVGYNPETVSLCHGDIYDNDMPPSLFLVMLASLQTSESLSSWIFWVILQLYGTFLLELVPWMLHWLFCILLSIFSFHLWCMLVFEFEWRATYFSSLRAKLVTASLGMPKWVWPSINWYSTFFIPTSALPASMHKNLPNMEGFVCKTTNSQPKVMLS